MGTFFNTKVKKTLIFAFWKVHDLLSSVSWMMLDDFTSEHIPINMCVNLSSSDTFVSQHALNGSQIGTTLQKVCRKGVSEGMWADIFANSDCFCQNFDDMEDHDAGNVLATFAYKDEIFVPGLDIHQVTVDEIELQFADSSWRNGHKALFVSFAFHLDETFFQVEIRKFQVA